MSILLLLFYYYYSIRTILLFVFSYFYSISTTLLIPELGVRLDYRLQLETFCNPASSCARCLVASL